MKTAEVFQIILMLFCRENLALSNYINGIFIKIITFKYWASEIKILNDFIIQISNVSSFRLLQEPCFNSKKYKGCKWSASRSKREMFQISTNPPPGIYEVNYKKPLNSKDEEFREMARRFSYLPRYIEAESLRIKAQVNRC